MANQQTRRGNLRGIQLKPSLNAINCADCGALFVPPKPDARLCSTCYSKQKAAIDATPERARGNWHSILQSLGVDGDALGGKHTACPGCGGKDRFRFDDKDGRGTFICSGGDGSNTAGDGFELLRHVYGWDYGEALKRVAGALGGVVVPTPNQIAPRAEKPAQGKIDAQTAAAVWDAAITPSDNHPHQYLVNKGIEPSGARIDSNGRLVVAAYNPDGAIAGYETITPDGRKQHNGQKSGCYFPIGAICADAPILIAEGFATAAALYAATGYSAVATFGAENLPRVAQSMRQRFPQTKIVVCADNDKAGRQRAQQAAAAIGAVVAIPAIEGGDFNDWFLESSASVAQSIAAAIAAPARKEESAPAVEYPPLPDHAPAPDDDEQPPRLTRVDLSILGTVTVPPTDCVINPILPRGEPSLLGAHGGAGKSILALSLAAHIACGRQWGQFPTQFGRVLFVSLEDSAPVVMNRLQRIASDNILDIASIASRLTLLDGSDTDGSLAVEFSLDGTRNIALTPLYQDIAEEAESGGYDLIVIDNASEAFAGNENDRRQVRAFMKRLGRLARKTNSAMLLLAHIDKAAAKYGAAGNSYSGSTAWHNSARSRLAIIQTDDGRQLIHEKNNLGKLAEPVALEWTEAGTLIPTDSSMAEAKQAAIDSLVLEAINRSIQAGIRVPAARSGTATTWHLLCLQDTLPEAMRDGGIKGKRALYASLDRLINDKQIQVETYQNEQRKVKQQIVVCSSAPVRSSEVLEQTGAAAQFCAAPVHIGCGSGAAHWSSPPEPSPAPANIHPSGWRSVLIKPLKETALIQRLQEKGYSNAGAAIQAAVKDGIIEKVNGGEYRCTPLRQHCASADG